MIASLSLQRLYEERHRDQRSLRLQRLDPETMPFTVQVPEPGSGISQADALNEIVGIGTCAIIRNG